MSRYHRIEAAAYVRGLRAADAALIGLLREGEFAPVPAAGFHANDLTWRTKDKARVIVGDSIVGMAKVARLEP